MAVLNERTAEIIAGVLRVVPVSRWTFASVGASGELTEIYGSEAGPDGAARLRAEAKLQRLKVPAGPSIAATLGTLRDFASGITLLFADKRSNYGVLTLLRTAELGPFLSSEISMLAFALDSVSDHLSALRLQPDGTPTTIDRGDAAATTLEPVLTSGAFYVLDNDFEIVLAWTDEQQRRVALTGLNTRISERLPSALEETVRALTAAWSNDGVNAPGVARPTPFLVITTQPMSGPAGLFIGVHVNRYTAKNSLTGAATRFQITPREVQVLALLLDGNHLDAIAKTLFITSSTVQDHIKNMLEKTGSRNRTELIARVLGWQ